MQTPRPMDDPCLGCPSAAGCKSSENYKCPRFHAVFVSAWDETVSFLRRLLDKEVPPCP